MSSTSSGPGIRPRGALFTMPVIVLNMGAEMVYILQQRLRAQEIPSDKSKKVLVDVLRAMFARDFLEELFRPQDLYRSKEVRAVFDKLAHASIMRLKEGSMDKLVELMVMGFKHQLVSASSPSNILHVTLNHLEAMRAATDDPAVVALVNECIRRTADTYARLPLGELFSLRQALSRFVQDRHVKVSIFLEDGLQLPTDGSIVLRFSGPVPPGAEVPGTVRYFDASGKLAGSEKLPSIAPLGATASTGPEGNVLDPTNRSCKLGANMYLKDRKKKDAATGAAKDEGAGADPLESKGGAGAGAGPASPLSSDPLLRAGADDERDREEKGAPKTASGSAQANLLARLLGGGGGSEASSSSGFHISLFADDGTGLVGADGAAGGAGAGAGAGGANVVTFAARVNNASSMMASLGLDDGPRGGGSGGGGGGAGSNSKESEGKDGDGDGGGDDLLDMMDALN
jgi:hypothetical protein